MELQIKNRIAIVTGASKGMGLATVKVLLAEGVKVMMVARNEIELKKIKKSMRDKDIVSTILLEM